MDEVREFEHKLWELTSDIVGAVNKIVEKRRGQLHCGKIYISLHETHCDWALEKRSNGLRVASWTAMRIRETLENSLSGQAVVHDGIVIDTSSAEVPERFRISLQWEKIVHDGSLIVVSVQ